MKRSEKSVEMCQFSSQNIASVRRGNFDLLNTVKQTLYTESQKLCSYFIRVHSHQNFYTN